MNIRKRLKGAVAVGALASMVFGTQALAQSSTTVSAAVVNGQRHLAVTNSSFAGPAVASFRSHGTESPFGVLVTDVAYENTGYDVKATLTNLYLRDLAKTNDYDCTETIPSSAFSVGYQTAAGAPTGVEALVDTLLTFSDDIGNNLTELGLATILSAFTGSSVSPQVQALPKLVADADVTSTLGLMGVADGGTGAFTSPAPHPICGGTGSTQVTLQSGTSGTPSATNLTELATRIFDVAESDADGDSLLTPTEAIADELLPADATTAANRATDPDTPGGALWESTRGALVELLDTSVSLITEAELDSLTTSVVADLTASSIASSAVQVVGQSGAYSNVPQLVLNRGTTDSLSSGLYQGVMTVTVTDR